MSASGAARSANMALIESYSFAQVREKLLLGKKMTPELVDAAIAEFRKYLTLIALGHKSIAMASRDVDEVWHTFILFTKDYAEFCDAAFGFFLHHQPSLPSQPMDPAARTRFVSAYKQEFGKMPSLWADGGPTDGCCGEDCSPTPSCSGEPDPTFTFKENVKMAALHRGDPTIATNMEVMWDRHNSCGREY